MKRLCYERGAEDNLTAVIVKVGTRAAASDVLDPNRTIDEAAVPLVATMSSETSVDDPSLHETVDALRPLTLARSELEADAVQVEEVKLDEGPGVAATQAVAGAGTPSGSSFGTFVKTLLFLILLLGVAAAAFFGGIYKQRRDAQTEAESNAAAASPSPSPAASNFSLKRDEIDASPAKVAKRMERQEAENSSLVSDPEFLYLYGRALFLSGAYSEASAQFARASELLKTRSVRDPLRIETRIMAAAAAMKSANSAERDRAAKALDEGVDPDGKVLITGPGATTGKKFPIGGNSSVSRPVELPR
jgi:hypothetical protein